MPTLDRPYYALVKRADPTFDRDRVNQVEYEFSRRTFTANPATRGAYNTNTNDDLVLVGDTNGPSPAPTDLASQTTPDLSLVDHLSD